MQQAPSTSNRRARFRLELIACLPHGGRRISARASEQEPLRFHPLSAFLSVSNSSKFSGLSNRLRGCNSRHGSHAASQLVQGTAAVHIRGRDGSIPSAATTVGTLGSSIEVLRSASGEAMITAPTGRLVRSFSANERRVRLPPLRRRFWNVRCAVGATPVSRTGCPPGPGSTPMRSANSGCSSIAERVVGDDEAAGAIPATQTQATVPRTGTRFCEDRWQRFESSQWHFLRRGLGNRAGLQLRLTVRFDS